MLTTLAEKVHPANAAVLVVDMQNDYCHPDGIVARDGASVENVAAMLPNLQRLLAGARRAGVPVVFARMANTEHTLSDVQNEQRQRRKRRHPCIEGTWGANFWGVAPEPGEAVVTKHRFSAFIGTDLDLILRSRGIRSLIVTGVATNVCVESTARDAFMMDYYVVFMADCTTCAAGPEAHTATLANIDRQFGVVASVDEIAACWDGLTTPAADLVSSAV